MKTGFKDRIEAHEKYSKELISEKIASGKVPYDKRTGCYVAQGNDYGVGVKQPIGSEKQDTKYGVPVGRVKTLETDYKA